MNAISGNLSTDTYIQHTLISFSVLKTSKKSLRARNSQRKKGESLNPSRHSRGWATKENQARVHAKTKHSRDGHTLKRRSEGQHEVKMMQQTDEWTVSVAKNFLHAHVLASLVIFVSSVLSTCIFRTYMFVAPVECVKNVKKKREKRLHWTFKAHLCHQPQSSNGRRVLIILKEEVSLKDFRAPLTGPLMCTLCTSRSRLHFKGLQTMLEKLNGMCGLLLWY